MPPLSNVGVLHFAFKHPGVLIVQEGSSWDVARDHRPAVGAIYHLETLDLTNAAVLTGVAKALGLSITTSWYTSDRKTDRWIVTSPVAPDFAGTYDEILAFVRGYFVACKRAHMDLERLRCSIEGLFDHAKVRV